MDKVTKEILSKSGRLPLLCAPFSHEEKMVPPFFPNDWHSLYYTMETAMETTDTTNLCRLVAFCRQDKSDQPPFDQK